MDFKFHVKNWFRILMIAWLSQARNWRGGGGGLEILSYNVYLYYGLIIFNPIITMEDLVIVLPICRQLSSFHYQVIHS